MKVLALFISFVMSMPFWFEDDPQTFARLYNSHEYFYSVQQTLDGGFILGSDQGLLKTDIQGAVEWQVSLPGRKVVIQNPGGSFMVAYTKGNDDYMQFSVSKFDLTGHFIFNKDILSTHLRLHSFKRTFDGG